MCADVRLSKPGVTTSMHPLKEAVHEATVHKNCAETFASLCSKLTELRIPIEEKDEASGEIVARCLTNAVNMGFWRCWSDSLLFQISEIGETETRVNVYALPNLLRSSVGRNERIVEVKELVSEVRKQTAGRSNMRGHPASSTLCHNP